MISQMAVGQMQMIDLSIVTRGFRDGFARSIAIAFFAATTSPCRILQLRLRRTGHHRRLMDSAAVGMRFPTGMMTFAGTVSVTGLSRHAMTTSTAATPTSTGMTPTGIRMFLVIRSGPSRKAIAADTAWRGIT